MARATFGGTAADTVARRVKVLGHDVDDYEAATLTVWSAQTGGTQYTDLLVNGSASNSVPVDSTGQVPEFQGPDGVTVVWVSAGGARVKMLPAEGPTDTSVAGYVTDPASSTRAALDGAYVLLGIDSTQGLMRKLETESADASLMVIGDSTGNDTNEWVYLLAQALASRYPAWTISYLLWNDGSTAYNAPVTIQTGTGSRTLTIYNVSVAGFHCLHFQGARAAAAIYRYEPDLTYISLGHNEPPPSSGLDLLWSRFVSLTESLSERINSDIVVIAQNPESLNTTYQDGRNTLYRRIAARRGFGWIDVHQAFLDYGNWAADLILNDGLGVHPNPAGTALWRDVVLSSLVWQKQSPPRTQPPSPLQSAGASPLLNADFVTLPDHSVPSLTAGGWWADANTTITRDTTIAESAAGSVSLTPAAAALARFGQTVDAKPFRNQWVTVAWRVYIPTGQAQSIGWVSLTDGTSSVTIPGTYSAGAWQWMVATIKVSATATDLSTSVQLDGSNGGTAVVKVQRVAFAVGRFPRALSTSPDRVVASQIASLASVVSGTGAPEGSASGTVGTIYRRADRLVRVNECKYPISDTSAATTGWVGTGGTLTNPTGYLRNTYSSGVISIQTASTSTMPVKAGKKYTFTGQARGSFAGQVKFLVQFYTSGGATTGAAVGGASTITLSASFADLTPLTTTAPSDAAYVTIRFYASGTAPTAGDTMDVRHVMYEQSAAAGTYFDGASTGLTEYTAAWIGTAEASASKATPTVSTTYIKAGPDVYGWKALD